MAAQRATRTSTIRVRDPRTLRILLWIDFACGFSTAAIGWPFAASVAAFLGFPIGFHHALCGISLVYAVSALGLALSPRPKLRWLLIQIMANAGWAAASTVFLFSFLPGASPWGQAYLVFQWAVVLWLTWAQWRQLVRAG